MNQIVSYEHQKYIFNHRIDMITYLLQFPGKCRCMNHILVVQFQDLRLIPVNNLRPLCETFTVDAAVMTGRDPIWRV